jgi:hypothetical protein
MSSRITWELLTTRLVAAVPGVAPPMRKNTSCTTVGSAGSAVPFRGWLPTCSRTGDLTGPAEKIIPDSFTPGTLATRNGTMPFVGTRVGKPRPITTVSGRVTLMDWRRW